MKVYVMINDAVIRFKKNYSRQTLKDQKLHPTYQYRVCAVKYLNCNCNTKKLATLSLEMVYSCIDQFNELNFPKLFSSCNACSL